MIEVGKRDRIFVAVVLPLALLGTFVYFVRQPLARERAALAAERAQLPDPDMFPAARRALEDRLAEAERERKAVLAEKQPESAVRGEAGETEAARVEAVFGVLHAKDVRIVKAEPVEATGRAVDVLRGTGLRPAPAARRLVLEADYAAVLEALRECEARRLAVVPGAFGLEPAETSCRWEVTLWL